MTDTQEILSRIAALRARLDQAHGLLQEADGAASTAPRDAPPEASELDGQVRKGAEAAGLIDSTLRPLTETDIVLPARLTARSARLLHQGRDLLQTLRKLAGQRAIREAETGPCQRLYRETLAMLETVLRTIQAFPPAPSVQLRLCAGLEAVLEVVEDRVKVLAAACNQREEERRRVDLLAQLFRKLATAQAIRGRDWQALTDDIIKAARQGGPLRLVRGGADDPYRFAAVHGLNVAQVVARVIVHDAEWQAQLEDCLLAALMHDVGMVHLPADLLAAPRVWTDAERRRMERHTAAGAQMLAKVFPAGGLIVESAQDHHERNDGTGYPSAKRDMQISNFTRLLSVCDTYASLCSGRPHRAAQDTRTALTDTLLAADKGSLDKVQASKLLRLSFYPLGSVVELQDGAVGIVVATHPGEEGLLHPSKPILLLMTETQGQLLPIPRLLDLLKEDDRSILRTLPSEARHSLLGHSFPQLV